MSGVRVDVLQNPDMADWLEPDEEPLWTGAPCHGRKLIETVGAERVWHIARVVGTLAMWAADPFIEPDRQATALRVFCAASAGFAGAAFLIANQRQ